MQIHTVGRLQSLVSSRQNVPWVGRAPVTSRFGQGNGVSEGDTFQQNKDVAGFGIPSQSLLPLPLSKARTTKGFVAAMKRLIKNSPWVTIDHAKLSSVAASLTDSPRLLDWKGYISDAAFDASPANLNRAMFELALNIANQSGFITQGADGKAQKWEIGGSGAAAMVQLIAKIREEKLLPGIDLTDPARIPAAIGPLLDGVPFKAERLAIFEEFAKPGAYQAIGRILDDAKTGENCYRFGLNSVKALAKVFPKSFGDDPFYKKAALVLIAMAGFSRPRGIEVELDVPVPADYRLPQTLEAFGVFRFPAALNEALNQGKAFHEDHPAVQHLRAASVVASAELSQKTGYDAAAIDALLWSAARKHAKAEPVAGAPSFQPKPHIMVPTMRF